MISIRGFPSSSGRARDVDPRARRGHRQFAQRRRPETVMHVVSRALAAGAASSLGPRHTMPRAAVRCSRVPFGRVPARARPRATWQASCRARSPPVVIRHRCRTAISAGRAAPPRTKTSTATTPRSRNAKVRAAPGRRPHHVRVGVATRRSCGVRQADVILWDGGTTTSSMARSVRGRRRSAPARA